jgi:hypothetical protein
MGDLLFDQYSLLHFSVGVIMYFWNISLINGFLLHLMFEVLENTTLGMSLINKYIIHKGYFSWPGGKNKADSYINSLVGDNLAFVIGWILSYYLDILGMKLNWYNK